MAVFAPSRSFDGSDLSTNVFGKIVKDGIRTISFREDRNKEGNFFLILPPYKADSNGRGVSWKLVPVRDNFGLDIKELYAVPRNDPVAYFASRAKAAFPDFCKVEQIIQAGKQVKRFPPFGRPTNKVIFNVAYLREMNLGSHVLTLPQFGGGEHIEAWGRRRMPDGGEAPLLNDPAAAIPIFIQLKKDATGQPWVVTPEASKKYQLPNELADATYLYNLDDVVFYQEVDYLLEKLRNSVPGDIFNRCMAGYQLPNGQILGAPAGGPVSSAGTYSAPPSSGQPGGFPVASIPQGAAPAPQPLQPTMPRAIVPGMPQAPVQQSASLQIDPPMPVVQTQTYSNPTAGGQVPFTVDQAREYLSRQRATTAA